MVKRKRLLCAVLACSFNFCSGNVLASKNPAIKKEVNMLNEEQSAQLNTMSISENVNIQKSNNDSNANYKTKVISEQATKNGPNAKEIKTFDEGNAQDRSSSSESNVTVTHSEQLTEEQINELKQAIFRDLTKGIENLKVDLQSSYWIFPVCKGYYAANARCSFENIGDLSVIRNLIVSMILSIFTYHSNVAHEMTPEEREAHKDDLSVRMSRWLGDGRLPKGKQASFEYWGKNVKLFSDFQWNATVQAYDLADKFLLNYEATNKYGSSARLVRLLNKENYVNLDREIKSYDTPESEIKQIHTYVNHQITNALKHLVFLVSTEYLTLPICDCQWATNLFCSEELVQREDFVCGAFMDMILSIFAFHINKVCHMSPEERKRNWNSISMVIARHLCSGNLPEGVQNSYEFWKNDYNARLFSMCQDKAFEEAYNLMDKYLTNYENKVGSISEMFSFLYKGNNRNKEIVTNTKFSEKIKNFQELEEFVCEKSNVNENTQSNKEDKPLMITETTPKKQIEIDDKPQYNKSESDNNGEYDYEYDTYGDYDPYYDNESTDDEFYDENSMPA